MPSEKKPTIHEHYIPRVYLRNFAISGDTTELLWAFSVKEMQQIKKPVSVESQCQKKYLYELRDKDNTIYDINKYENAFQTLEKHFGIIVSTIIERVSDIKHDYYDILTEEEIEILKIYLMSQILRYEKTLNLASDVVKEQKSDFTVIEQKNEAIKICLNFLDTIYIEDDEHTPTIDWKNYSSKVDKCSIEYRIYDWFKNKNFALIKSNSNSFFTCDNPIYIYQLKSIVFPLSSQIALILTPSNKSQSKICIDDNKLITYARKSIISNAVNYIYYNKEFSEEDKQLIESIKTGR